MALELECEKFDVLSKDTFCYQVDNGTIFHYKWSPPQRLYVRTDNYKGEAVADLPSGLTIKQVIAHGDAVFFNTTNEKICKASFESGKIEITYVRDLLENESMDYGAVLRQYRDNKKYVHRMADDPTSFEGIQVPQGYEKHIGMLKGIHRYKAVFVKNSNNLYTSYLENNIISLLLPVDASDARFYASDSSSFIYIHYKEELFSYDTATNKMLPPLKFRGISNSSIVGVVNGVITVAGLEEGSVFLFTAKPPEGYYNDPNAVGGWLNEIWADNKDESFKKRFLLKNEMGFKAIRLNLRPSRPVLNLEKNQPRGLPPITDFLGHLRTSWGNYGGGTKKREQEISATINELLDKNEELDRKIKEIKSNSDKSLQKTASPQEIIANFIKDNDEVEETIARLERENEEISKNLERTDTLNDELAAANEKLAEENELIEKETKKSKETLAAEAAVEFRELKKRFEELMMQNNELCESLTGNCEDSKIKKILEDNEKMKKDLSNN